MKILILGAGKMGSFFCDLLSFDHDVAVYDPDPKRLRFTFNAQRFKELEEVREFDPQLVINASTVKYTLDAFKAVLPYLSKSCIISDIASVLGKIFFRDIYSRLHLNIVEYTFKEHDETIAYSLSIPFAATLAFAGVMKHQEAPGTTFKRHMQIARGLMSEDDYLVSEILFNPNTPEQLMKIQSQMAELLDIIKRHDSEAMKAYLARVRQNVE